MFIDEHVQIAAHQNNKGDNANTGRQAETGCNIHNLPHSTHSVPRAYGPEYPVNPRLALLRGSKG